MVQADSSAKESVLESRVWDDVGRISSESRMGEGATEVPGSSSSFHDGSGLDQVLRDAIHQVADVAVNKFYVVSDGSEAIRAMGKLARNKAGPSKIPPKHGSSCPP